MPDCFPTKTLPRWNNNNIHTSLVQGWKTNRKKLKLIEKQWEDGQILRLKKDAQTLYVAYADNRAAKDEHNRKRDLQWLEKQIKAGKLTKSSINNKGYNKYLKMKGDVTIEIDYEK